MLHLAVFTPGFIKKIFTGQKSIDGRFSKIKCMPYEAIESGDLVLMKRSGSKIVGYFIAGDIAFYSDLTRDKLQRIVSKHRHELALSKEFLDKKLNSRYLTLIRIQRPTKFRIPIVVKKKSLSAWINLGGESQKQIQLF